MNNIIAIEIDQKRVLTTVQLANSYETTERRISENFNSNKGRYMSGKHFYLLEGENLRQFKSEYGNSVVASNVNKLYLWTERGALLHAKSLNTDKAWDVYDKLVESYFRASELKKDINDLSPQLQLLINMELEHKKLRQELTASKEETAAVKEEVQDIREVIVINPGEEWRKQTNKLISKVCFKLKDYKKPKDEIYRALEVRAKCKLNIRLKNLQARAALNGIQPSRIKQLNNLDVIANDIKLKEIYISIIKEIAIKHGVSV